MARAVLTRRSRIVALLFSHIDNPFHALALEKLCAALQAHGQNALVVMMPDTAEGETVARPLHCRVGGIVTASVELPSRLCDECHAFGIPVVMLNRAQDDERLSAVTTDTMRGGRMAAAHLVGIGRRRVALLAGRQRASTNRDRKFGFLAELEARGLALHARAVGHFDLARTEAATLDLFDRAGTGRPDAVFVANDDMAFRAMSVLRAGLGLRVPEDVAVMGFDDVPLAAAPEYGLTTLRQPLEQMVAHAVRIPLAAIESPGAPRERIALAPSPVRRSSTGGSPSTGAAVGRPGPAGPRTPPRPAEPSRRRRRRSRLRRMSGGDARSPEPPPAASATASPLDHRSCRPAELSRRPSPRERGLEPQGSAGGAGDPAPRVDRFEAVVAGVWAEQRRRAEGTKRLRTGRMRGNEALQAAR